MKRTEHNVVFNGVIRNNKTPWNMCQVILCEMKKKKERLNYLLINPFFNVTKSY